MLANPLPQERSVSSFLQQRGFAFLLRLFIILLAQQSFPLLRQGVVPAAMLKASSALAGFLLASQPALAQTTPAAPTGFIVTGSNGRVVLTWTKPPGTITGYKLRYSKTSTRDSATWAAITTGDAGINLRSYTVTGLDNGAEYSFQVRAVNANGDGTATGWVTATPFTTVLTVTPGDKQVTLNWSISGSNILPWAYRQKKGAGSYGSWQSAGARTARSKTITGLENGSAYTFQVAVNHSGTYTLQSNEVSATPTAAATPGVTLSKSELTVNEGSTGVYTVKLATDPGGTVTVSPSSADPGAVSVSPSSLTFDSSSYSTAQTVTVTGESDADTTNESVNITHGVSGYGSVTSGGTVAVTVTDTTTPASAPAAPTGLVGSVRNGGVRLRWTKPSGAITGYKVRYGKTGERDSATWAAIPSSSASTTNYTVTGLDNGSEYSFQIRAVNSAGDGTATGWVTATPLTTALTVTPGDKQVTLNWSLPVFIESSRVWVYRQKKGAGSYGGWQDIPGGAAVRSKTVTGLENGSPYSFQVALKSGSSYLFQSNEASATPVAATTPGVTLSKSELTVNEGSTGVYTVKLATDPGGTVTVSPTSADPGAASVSPSSLTFNSSTYNTAQTVTVTGESDTDTANENVNITHGVGGYTGVTSGGTVAVTVTDTTTPTPAAPTGLSATAGNRQVALTWTKPPGTITGYEVRYLKGVGSYNQWAAIPDSDATTVSHTVMVPGRSQYSFQIRAVNGALKGTASATVTATPTGASTPILSAPAAPRAAPARAGAVTITFNKPDPSVEKWQVRYGPTSERGNADSWTWKDITPTTASGLFQLEGMGLLPGTLLAAITPSQFNHALTEMGSLPGSWIAQTGGPVSLTVPGLDSRVRYCFQVRGIDGNGDPGMPTPCINATPGAGTASNGSGGGGGGSSTTTPRTTTPVFQLPSDPTPVTEGEAITLEVTSSSPLTGTHAVSLTFSDRNGSGFTASDIPGGLGPRLLNAAFGSSPSRSGTITIPTSSDSAVEGREHYRIKLNAATGYSLGSNTTADGTLLDPVPAKPTGLTATPGHGQVTLNWDDPKDASITGWQVRELWIRLSQIRHDHWPHVDFGLREGVGGKTGKDMD